MNLKNLIMKSSVIVFIFVFLFFSACINGSRESDWGEVIIPSEADLVFIEPKSSNDAFYGNIIAVPLDKEFKDTLFVTNINLMQKICYIKLSRPDKDIKIEYVKSMIDSKENAARFINFVE